MARHRRPSADRGATAVEYALIVSLIAVVVLVAVALVGANLRDSFSDSNEAIDNAIEGVVLVDEQVPVGGGPKGCPAGSVPSTKSKGKCVKVP